MVSIAPLEEVVEMELSDEQIKDIFGGCGEPLIHWPPLLQNLHIEESSHFESGHGTNTLSLDSSSVL